ncbi:MAG TPA: Ig-like domain-containing protein [Solirubrobacteraceae bacterium]|nr:Ig-like domain-containing protein [Solirubrobacteraceae bacterium]
MRGWCRRVGLATFLFGTVLLTLAPAALGAPTWLFAFSFGGPGTADGEFTQPLGVAVSPTNGDVYISDAGAGRLQIFSPSGGFIGQAFGTGTASGCTGFVQPVGVAVNPSNGDVYVVDSGADQVFELGSAGNCLGSFGSAGQNDGQFDHPLYDAIDPATGDVYVTDPGNSRVEEFTSSGGFLSSFGADVFGANRDWTNEPDGIAFDPIDGGLVYVTDTEDTVEQFSPTGASTALPWDFPGASELAGVALDPASDTLYVTDPADGEVLNFFHVDGGDLVESDVANAQPYGLAFSSATEDMYFTDPANSQVEVFAAQPPICQQSSESVAESTPATIALTCSDQSFQPQTIAITSNPSHGTLGSIDQTSPTSATVTYTPNTGYNGPDSFTFDASGVGTSAPVTVSLTVGWVDQYYQPPSSPPWAGPPLSTLSAAPPASSGSPSAPEPAVLSALRVISETFTVGRARASGAVKLLLSFHLSRAASVTFTLERATAGRREGDRCVAASSANRNRPACVRRVHAPRSTTRDEAAGPDAFTVTHRLDGMELRPGSYALTATPVSGEPQTIRFSITR